LSASSNEEHGLRELKGLNSAAARSRLDEDGPNELAARDNRGLLRIAGEVLAEPMFLLLIGAASIYLVLGHPRDALILAASILVVVFITIYQERRTEHALEALRDLSSPRALVIRDGKEIRIAGREVVRGDLLLLSEGDRVPADAVLRAATELYADESLLTGESVPVSKRANPSISEMKRPGDEGNPFVYSGTLVVRGHATAEVLATGPRSEIGRIGRALVQIEPERTPLQRETGRIVKILAVAGLALCAMVAVGFGALRGGWLEGALAGITLAMSVMPEEYPVVLTVFLALGAWRISRRSVLTRRMPAIETLGATTVLAVDKTGTLTENRMQVAFLDAFPVSADLRVEANLDEHEALHGLLQTALAASELDVVDPMERAIQSAAHTHTPDAVATLSGMRLVHEYELSAELLAVTHVWQTHDEQWWVAAKGAPEAIADLCRLDPERRRLLIGRAETLASEGLRVIAVASGEFHGTHFPEAPQEFSLRPCGLVGLADPLRASVPAAIAECHAAGIRVVMITGDHPATALAIANAAGLDSAAGVLTGDEIAMLDDEALRSRVRKVGIFARTVPEQKLRLVRAMKANGEVVAMTGDGVNDAPALKAAHIGVAMGGRGTDVAREAAALVLLEDDFASLVAAVRLGRRIYDNIRNAMTYLLAIHIPLGGMGLLPVLAGWPLFLLPVHVVFLEFIIDPACSLVFEAEHANPHVMQRPPRDPRAPLFSRHMIGRSILLGSSALIATAGAYGLALTAMEEGKARAIGFATLLVANLALILVTRSRTRKLVALLGQPNRPFWWISLLALASLVIAIYVPGAASVFRFDPPPTSAFAAAILSAIVAVWGIEALARSRRQAGE